MKPTGALTEGPPHPSFSITDGLVVDPVGAVVERRDLFVTGGRIVAPQDVTETYDAHGLVVMPGLIDMHVHLVPSLAEGRRLTDDTLSDCARTLEAMLAGGITAVRDLGGDLAVLLALRRAQRDGVVVGSRVFIAGPVLTVPSGHGLQSGHGIAVSSTEAAAAVVAGLAEARVDVVKVVTSGARGDVQMPGETFAAIRAESNRHGLRVAAHAHFQPEQLCRSVELAVDSIEHGFLLHTRPDLFSTMVRNGTAYCPTLRVIERIREDPEWRGQRIIPRAWDDALASVMAAFVANVSLVAGTDFGVFGVGPTDVWREVSLIGRTTGSRMAGVKAATAGAADALGIPDLGRVGVGAIADLIVLRRDPTQDDVGANDVVAVFQGGTHVAGRLGRSNAS